MMLESIKMLLIFFHKQVACKDDALKLVTLELQVQSTDT